MAAQTWDSLILVADLSKRVRKRIELLLATAARNSCVKRVSMGVVPSVESCAGLDFGPAEGSFLAGVGRTGMRGRKDGQGAEHEISVCVPTSMK